MTPPPAEPPAPDGSTPMKMGLLAVLVGAGIGAVSDLSLWGCFEFAGVAFVVLAAIMLSNRVPAK